MAAAHPILRLENRIQPYDWGSRTAIAELLGEPPSGTPQAELWMGAHPRAPSRVRTDGGEVPLDAWIARDPEAALGAEVAARFEKRLPFLFKVLAAERPLSLQAHPGAEQARAGFERERRRGLADDDPERCYADPNAKSELISALTPFRALCGFREPPEIAERFAAVGAPELEGELAALHAGGSAALRPFLEALLAPGAARAGLVERAARWARHAGTASGATALLELAALHPGDVGALAPLFLHEVRLAPGEAMFLPPGELHAYLGGVGLELMANSDNVLRAGLTGKPVHVPELLDALRYRTGPPERLRPLPTAIGEAVYRTPALEFALSVIDTRGREGFERGADHGVEILFCSEGEAALASDGREPLLLARGASLFVPAAAGGYALSGEAVLHRAHVPRA